jgi:UDP-3-O-acyl N-acetylglucosamine deacetylase
MTANVRRCGLRCQRTIARAVEVVGVGFLTGATVGLRFVPAPPSSGAVFVRTDLPGRPRVPATIEQVTGTNRRTTIGDPPVQVGLVEHVLGALAGLRIDNCLIEVDAPEPPGLDGSARDFVEALVSAGAVRQNEARPVWCVDCPVVLSAGGATLALHPPRGEPSGLVLTYFLNYGPCAPIARQMFTQELTAGAFRHDVAPCRTFLLEAEAMELRRQGLGSRTTTADLLVFGPRGPIDNALRFANEPARHKVLDMIGDLSLLGADLSGHVVAYRSGHPLNIELVRALRQLVGSVEQQLAA